MRVPESLHHTFRLIALDWEVLSAADAANLIEPLLARGARAALFTDGDLRGVAEAAAALAGPHARNLYVAARGDGALLGFDRRGRPLEIAAGPPGAPAEARLRAALIEPLQIERHDVLVIAGSPGPALDGVRVAPGGAVNIREALALQSRLDEELGDFAPPRDAAWVVEEAGFDLAREHEIESLLSIANGYLGSRGSIAEGSSASRPATFIAGAFEPSADVSRVPELVIAPDWGRMRFVIEGEPLSVETGDVVHHRRALDLRRGALLRDCVASGPAGHMVHLRTLHAASLADRHVLIEAVGVAPLNFTGKVEIDAILSGDVRSASGAAHWESFDAGAGPSNLWLVGRTRNGLTAAMTSHLHADESPGAPILADRTTGQRSAAERVHLEVRCGERRDLFRTVTLHTSRDLDVRAAGQPDPLVVGEALRDAIEARAVRDVLRDHERAWAERWDRADVEIDGAPKIERALRFASYHLISAATPEDPRTSVGARALSGEAYRGHVFWDTEIFMLPFYVCCYPEAARSLLRYRYLTLPGARRKAAAAGYQGALYAWESTDTGDETTPSMVIAPTGEVIRILSGEMEQHISADVAYAVWAHARTTGSERFLRREGLEILVETARFWASRGELGADGRYHIRHVIGPDEYHEDIDDSAFTNWMARHNLRIAAAAADDADPEIAARLDLRPGEAARWRELADRMYLGIDPGTGLIEQFAGYFQLEPFFIADYAERTAPIDVLLGRARTQACQVVKQADVVQLITLLWDEIPPPVRRQNFLYYEPRTAHGSSLSPGIHALVAARLGLAAQAERFFDQTADIDLGNNMGNSAGGVHAAGLGSLWQAVVFGAAGVRAPPLGEDEDALVIEPNLLPGWRHMKVPLGWRGRSLVLHLEADAIELSVLEGEAPLRVRAARGGAEQSVLAEPGRRYAARADDEGFRRWEEIGS